MRALTITAILLSAYALSGQNLREIERLTLALENADNDQKVELLSELAMNHDHDTVLAYQYLNQLWQIVDGSDQTNDLALYYLTLGNIQRANFQHDLAQLSFQSADSLYALINNHLGRARVQNDLGMSVVRQREYEMALQYFRDALDLLQNLPDSAIDKLRVFNNIGYAHYGLGNSDSSIYYYFKVVPYCEDNTSKICADMNNNLGIMYSEIGEADKAIDYHKKSLTIKAHNQDTLMMATSLMNIAGVYFFQNDFDSCTYYVTEAMKLYEISGNLQGAVICNNNLAAIYNETKQYKKSIAPAKRALAIAKQINDQFTYSGSYQNMAEAYHQMGNNQLAQVYSDSSLIISKKINSKYLLQQNYDLISRINLATSQYKKAYEYRELYHVYSDSIFNENKSKQIATLEAQYENEKKENEINLQAAKIREQELTISRNRTVQLASLAGLSFIIVLGYALFNRRQLKQAAVFETERAQLKAEQVSAIIDSQEKERSRFAKDLHDSFGQLISAMRLNINRIDGQRELLLQEVAKKGNDMLDQLYVSMKNIAFDLMPQTLVEKGLGEAIDELSDQISNVGNIKMNVVYHDSGFQLSHTDKLAVYRTIQEVVNNILKYANANKIDISITDLGNELNILIEDNGMGFDTMSLKQGKGNGWRNIQSRLDMIGGDIEYDSISGRQGTTVSISVPLRGVQNAA